MLEVVNTQIFYLHESISFEKKKKNINIYFKNVEGILLIRTALWISILIT